MPGKRLPAEKPLPQGGWECAATPKRRVQTLTVNLVESPLGWLLARGMLTERQFGAGEKLREDWERAQLSPRITSNWDSPPTSKADRAAPRGFDLTLAQLAAKRRFNEAIEAVGSGLTDVLWRVVCAGEGMRDAETALGWPARAGKVVLGIALDRLADHYCI